MNQQRKNEISNELWLCGTDGEDASGDFTACAGPVAAHILRLEERIEELRSKDELYEGLLLRIERLESAAKPVEIVNVVDDPAPDFIGKLSVSDVVELSRALRGVAL